MNRAIGKLRELLRREWAAKLIWPAAALAMLLTCLTASALAAGIRTRRGNVATASLCTSSGDCTLDDQMVTWDETLQCYA